MLNKASQSLSKSLRGKIAEIVRSFGTHFKEVYAFNRSEDIEENRLELSSPLSIIGALREVVDDIRSLVDDTKKQGLKHVDEDRTTKLVMHHSALLARLIPIRPKNERDKVGNAPIPTNLPQNSPWNAKEATRRLKYLLVHFTEALDVHMFSEENARTLYKEKATADDAYKSLFERLRSELPKLARLHMSTIGSSHRLPGDKNDIESDGGLARRFQQLFVSDSGSEDESDQDPPKDTIVIFDESGCIPSYELLGLSRLGRTIKSLVLVGDKKQLPPYDPMQGRRKRKGSRLVDQSECLNSLLDSSALTVDSGKVLLTTQYRVPKDIADMLNNRVYRGQYNTCPFARVPLSGLHMVHVPWSESQRRKYVNPNEVEEGIFLLQRLVLDYEIGSTLVITPVSIETCILEFLLSRFS